MFFLLDSDLLLICTDYIYLYIYKHIYFLAWYHYFFNESIVVEVKNVSNVLSCTVAEIVHSIYPSDYHETNFVCVK